MCRADRVRPFSGVRDSTYAHGLGSCVDRPVARDSDPYLSAGSFDSPGPSSPSPLKGQRKQH